MLLEVSPETLLNNLMSVELSTATVVITIILVVGMFLRVLWVVSLERLVKMLSEM